MVKACTFDICPRRLAFGLFAGPSSGEWAWSWTMGRFPWQSDSGQMTGQWLKAIIYQYSRIGKLRASQRDIANSFRRNICATKQFRYDTGQSAKRLDLSDSNPLAEK